MPTNAKAGPSAAILLVFLSLVAIGAMLFAHWPVLSANVMSYDDEEAIVQNHLVQHPSWDSVQRFFSEVLSSSVVRGYYRPLTLTSLMLDWAMGARPDDLRVFHRTSLALHLGSTVLVILLCYQIFRRPIVAALVGLLFGVHPLTVEPIAWVMERKTILAAFFAFACLCSYLRYTHCGRWRWFAAALVLFLLSLLSKPTGTPLPIIMLLIDYWPLGRLNRRAVLEKLPFLALSAVFAVLTCVCEQRVSPLTLPASQSPLHLTLRVCYLIVFYFCKILLPIHLSSVYVLPDPLSLRNPIVVLSVAGTIVLIAALAISRRWTPAWGVGAAIFLVGLAPTMGFVGYSWMVASDKYVYLPAVGLLLILAWLLERIWSGGTEGTRRVRHVATAAAVVVVAGLLVTGTHGYLSHWQTTGGLCDYMIDLAPGAPAIYNNRGDMYFREGRHDLALRDFTKAIELRPDYAVAYCNMGLVLFKENKLDEALGYCRKARDLKPDLAPSEYTMGDILTAKGKTLEAVACYQRALLLRPDDFKTMNNLAWALSVHDFARPPTDIDPVALAEKACRQTQYKESTFLDTLAAAYAGAGRFPEAVRTAQEAIRLADAAGDTPMSGQIRRRLALYQSGRPYREPPYVE